MNQSRWQGFWSKHLLVLTWVHNWNPSWNISCFPSPPCFCFQQIIHRLFMRKYIKSTKHWNSSLDSMILSHFQRAVFQIVVRSIGEPWECIQSHQSSEAPLAYFYSMCFIVIEQSRLFQTWTTRRATKLRYSPLSPAKLRICCYSFSIVTVNCCMLYNGAMWCF